ncbi:dynactin subunit 4 [Dermatophagoides farinae]|uniref:Dynactin subunit 4 n=1 Tax=Dermatophagoides farinae TaxID=6954 RepID=A0A922HS35_DERFA|nr:dynactin subunit 4-like [Dermatophagoides farinae]KAH7640178.1 dynactin subunit 4-like protein [Dermatophagoides farinae]KAH9506661.1 Dynactin subunit 4 [Dermatophagoides farinae]
MLFISPFLDSQCVQYQCSCKQWKTIHYLYFCRYCDETRCRDCVSHEVDSQFCPQCLEYIPMLDAKLKKNKCAQCYQCPCCQNTLSTRIQLLPVHNPDPTNDSQPNVKKLSYYFCYFCRWSSRDIGIPDQSSAGGGFTEPKVPESERLESLSEYYRILSLKEKNEKEKKRMVPRTALSLLDKYGITSTLSPKVTATLRARMARNSSGVSTSDLTKSFPQLEDFKPSIGLSEDALPKLNIEQYYGPMDNADHASSVIDVGHLNTLQQTLNQIERQPQKCSDLYPTSQQLVVKRSLRCKKCDHNLSKPEYNPSLIKFKIQLSAYYIVPELRILKSTPLKLNETTRIELTLTNPTQYLINVTLLPVDIINNPIADVILPNTVLQLTPKDDTGDLVDVESSSSKFNDDPNVISFRQGNKIGVYLFVTPKQGNGVECQVQFRMKHDYVHSILPSTLKPANQNVEETFKTTKETKWVTHMIKVNLANISD